MNIWIINHFAYGPDQSAGTRHYSLARALIHRGHSVLVLASSFYHKGREEKRLTPEEVYRRDLLHKVLFQWIRTPPYKNSHAKRIWNMTVFAWRVYLGNWREKHEHPDVIIGSSPSLLAALASLCLARKMHAPFVLEVRDIWPDSLRDAGGVTALNPVYILFKYLERFLYRKADYIITLLPNSYEYIVASGGYTNKIAWIPNVVDLTQRPPLPPNNKKAPFVVIYFGSHGLYNGLEKVIDAAILLQGRGWGQDDIRFVLIGEGPAKQSLISKAKRNCVNELVEFRDAVPKTDLWLAIKDAHAFLMIIRPMRCLEKGISPNKLWEYFATARPVIFSTVGGANIAEESHAGVAVEPGDSSGLADAIEGLYALDEEEREKMGKNGRKYVAEKADLQQVTSRLERLLIQVVADYKAQML